MTNKFKDNPPRIWFYLFVFINFILSFMCSVGYFIIASQLPPVLILKWFLVSATIGILCIPYDFFFGEQEF